MKTSDSPIHIHYVSASGREQRFTLQGPLVVGRDFGCDVIMEDLRASRRHARFYTDEDGTWVEDLNSSNGSFLNGRRLLESTKVADGDVLSIGSAKFTVRRYDIIDPQHPLTVSVTDAIERVSQEANVWQRLLLLPPVRTVEQLVSHVSILIRDTFSMNDIQIWQVSGLEMRNLQPLVTKNIPLFTVTPDIEQKVMSCQQAMVLPSQSVSPSLEQPHVLMIPIVLNKRVIGVMTALTDSPSKKVLETLIVIGQWFAKEWATLSPWIDHYHYTSHQPFITSLQWMMIPLSSHELPLSSFQKTHTLRCAMLSYLVRHLDWSDKDRYLVESALAWTYEGCDTPQFAQRLAWLAQAEDAFGQELYQVLQNYCRVAKQDDMPTVKSDERLQMMLFVGVLLDVMEFRSDAPIAELMTSLQAQESVPELFTVEDLLNIFDLVQKIDTHTDQTELFIRQ